MEFKSGRVDTYHRRQPQIAISIRLPNPSTLPTNNPSTLEICDTPIRSSFFPVMQALASVSTSNKLLLSSGYANDYIDSTVDTLSTRSGPLTQTELPLPPNQKVKKRKRSGQDKTDHIAVVSIRENNKRRMPKSMQTKKCLKAGMSQESANIPDTPSISNGTVRHRRRSIIRPRSTRSKRTPLNKTDQHRSVAG